jgi:HlyD family secretion protein
MKEDRSMGGSKRLRAYRAGRIGVVALALAGCSNNEDGAFTGYVEADLVYVSAPVAGQLRTLSVARGARVAAGAPLFQLDTDIEALTRAEAAARAAQSDAQASNLRSGKRPPEIKVIEDQLAQAKAAAQASAAQLRRYENLASSEFVSANLLQNLRAQADADAARVAELQSQLVVARIAARPQEIAAADASVVAAKAALEQARWREGQAAQAAPVAALVYDTTFRVGERVPVNTPVVVLLPDGATKLRFFVPEPMLGRIVVGQTVNVSCDGCPDGLVARIEFVSPQAEFTPPVIYSNESRAKLVFMVEARPTPDSAGKLKPGQPVQVRLAAQ